jgi:mRNA-degrading endonuclease RelE of RelBE toxin-antitoxin system
VVKYSLEIKHSAQKELDALDQTPFTRLDRKILALAESPAARGDWRVLYIVDDAAKLISVTRIVHRSEVYE